MALQDRTGQKVPSVVFRTRVGDTWKDVSTDDLFKGKKVVVFSLPGAFTPNKSICIIYSSNNINYLKLSNTTPICLFPTYKAELEKNKLQ